MRFIDKNTLDMKINSMFRVLCVLIATLTLKTAQRILKNEFGPNFA